MIVTLILALLSIFFTFSSPAGAATINVNCPADDFQTALDNANPGDTIVVSGHCTGNFLVRNDKTRVFIQSTGVANNGCSSFAILDGGASGTVLDIRGKAISVTCMAINFGDNGIVVQRGSNAVLDRNLVAFTNGIGITVASSAFAVITNNEIKGNATGILVTESSSARIGWNNGFQVANPGPAAPNDIHNNGNGIIVMDASSAGITSNTIHNNVNTGIGVWSGAHANISNNAIDGNGNGIWVSDNSVVKLSGFGGIFQSPNSTTTNNSGFGFVCTQGGSRSGDIGTLNGVMGQSSFDPSCV